MTKLVLTDKSVRALEPPASGNRIDYDVPRSASDTAFVRGFAVRTTAAGWKAFLLVYVTAEGRERRHVIGDFGPHTVTSAREQARRLRLLVNQGRDPFAERQEQRAAEDARRVRASATFGALLSAYVEALRFGKKASADGVAREIAATIEKPHPKTWRKAVDEVTLDDLVVILNALTKAGKWRQAEKTRSYIRAAYTMAAASRGNAKTAHLFAPFAALPNIGRDLATIERPTRLADDVHEDGKRALTLPELAAYWGRIRNMPGAAGALLRFHLLTGAQRCAQLARITARNVDAEAHTVTILDGKGRRRNAREHVVPLLPHALAAIELMRGGEGPHVFTLDGGATGAGFHAVRRHVAAVSAAMVDAGEVGEPFTPGELRITVETRLAAAGVSMETRAQLQSHGLGGVQNRHYDKHDYAREKRRALETLLDLMESGRSNVVAFAARVALA
ncbi:integrase family protein [Lysobacter sp. A6]|uniref:Integrase family protein n=1 Tax=Noviluteimonas lactosilytica TaxID=2888523 RepID=A0ABS8JDV6_9GAMM|nr:integrase family protein [Lysobacter lactosilyticus]MCC8361695.1 integrase family protein [Lysobacter lactosilyticus]